MENTVLNIVEEIPVPENSSILREAIVFLGKMKHPLRLIETMDIEWKKIVIIVNDAEYKGALLRLKKYLSSYFLKKFSHFKDELFKSPGRTSLGRKKCDHEQIFKETLEQAEKGNLK